MLFGLRRSDLRSKEETRRVSALCLMVAYALAAGMFIGVAAMAFFLDLNGILE